MMFFAQLEKIYRADQVVVDQSSGTAVVGYAGENGRVCGAIQDPVDCRKSFEVLRVANVSKSKVNAQLLQQGFVLLGPGA